MAENVNQNASAVVEHLRAWNSKAVEEVIEFHGETTIVVHHTLLRSVALECRDALQFNLLSDATCVDRYPVEPRFELQYHLTSIPNRTKIRLRTRVPGDQPNVDSLVPVWLGAGWLEREIFDLMGINFNDHPDLRRILLPDDWKGHPLRKDYPVEGFRDIPATYLPGLKK
ncbi:MAG: NADH-quinone oxidoreductase subunit C [Acidobacteria bacterium]|nr:NADH-quinone oxidoreductase subunit C [Acidobacteriota bacterium]MBS1866704.1 NADH-quinone oxidoreductase subunit C [Acidobacteriota bacterium]